MYDLRALDGFSAGARHDKFPWSYLKMRALTSLTTMLTLALGLVACGDDGKGTSVTTTPTTDPTAATDMSAGTTTAGNTTGDTPTTSTSPTTTGDEASAGTTMDPTAGTTTDPSDGTTTDPTAGTTTDPSDGTTTDPSGGSSTGGPGEDLYGPCDAMGMCPADQLCLMVGMIEGNFCAPDCEGMGCPAVPAGVTAQAMCVLTKPMEDKPTSCALICDPKMMDMCPSGMTCKPVPMQTIGLCTAP